MPRTYFGRRIDSPEISQKISQCRQDNRKFLFFFGERRISEYILSSLSHRHRSFAIKNIGSHRESVTTIVRADNLLYFAVGRFVRKFRRKCVGVRVIWQRETSELVQICFLGAPFGPSVHGDLLLRRNLLVFCPYILVLKWRKIVEMPLCLSHFFSSFKRKEKKNSQGRSKAPAIFRRAFKRQRIRKRRDSANTNVHASFSFCNVNAPANFGPESIPLRV